MNTFEKEVTWGTWQVNPETDKMEEIEKTKILTFKEFDFYDKPQHDYHFKIGALPDHMFKTENDYLITPAFIKELTVDFINTLLVIPDANIIKPGDFNVTDKIELLTNSQSLFILGDQLFKEKITPFFLRFRKLTK